MMSSSLCLVRACCLIVGGSPSRRLLFPRPLRYCSGSTAAGAGGGGGGGSRTASGDPLWRRIWKSWIPIPTGVGLTLLAVIQWRRIRRRDSPSPADSLTVANPWEIECYRALPLRYMSRVFGWVSERELPEVVRSRLYTSYSRMFGVNMAEVSLPLNSYPSLSDFFCRQLKHGCRPIDKRQIVSPADGRVLSAGKVQCCRLDQVKGVTYNIESFLGPPISQYITNTTTAAAAATAASAAPVPVSHRQRNEGEEGRGRGVVITGGRRNSEDEWERYKRAVLFGDDTDLYQVVIYLGPGDYHRFHSPAAVSLHHRRHFQGELLSVNPRMAGWIPGLFALNERVCYFGSWYHGFFSFTAVGATNVGSIHVYKDKELQTNGRKWRDGTTQHQVRLDTSWEKGEEIGEFRMGSTVVLLFEAPTEFELCLKPGDRIRVGQTLMA